MTVEELRRAIARLPAAMPVTTAWEGQFIEPIVSVSKNGVLVVDADPYSQECSWNSLVVNEADIEKR